MTRDELRVPNNQNSNPKCGNFIFLIQMQITESIKEINYLNKVKARERDLPSNYINWVLKIQHIFHNLNKKMISERFNIP